MSLYKRKQSLNDPAGYKICIPFQERQDSENCTIKAIFQQEQFHSSFLIDNPFELYPSLLFYHTSNAHSPNISVLFPFLSPAV